MKRVTGLGGIFFKCKDPESVKDWYAKHLGLPVDAEGGINFQWRDPDDPKVMGRTVWASFPDDTDYFQPSRAQFMINYRVDDLKALLARLREEGVQVDNKVEEYDYGKFGWITDPEGNRIELWEPPK